MTHHSTVALPGNPNMSQYIGMYFMCVYKYRIYTFINKYLEISSSL
jgi:uncharacterized membrane protein (DUF106 family)